MSLSIEEKRGLKIKALREKQGYTQDGFSKKTTFSFASYQNAENKGQGLDSIMKLKKIAECLNVPIAELLMFDDELEQGDIAKREEALRLFKQAAKELPPKRLIETRDYINEILNEIILKNTI